MILKGLIDEDFVNYKKPAIVLEFPYCSFKCDKECGRQVCQNSGLATAPAVNIDIYELIIRYLQNPISEAIVCQGLEPFDSWDELKQFITAVRMKTKDDIVLYTGYTKEELEQKHYLTFLKKYDNIYIKYGRFIPDQDSHYDEILGVKLASPNQYAERIN